MTLYAPSLDLGGPEKIVKVTLRDFGEWVIRGNTASTCPLETLPPGTQVPHSEEAQATWEHMGVVQPTGPAEVLEDDSHPSHILTAAA